MDNQENCCVENVRIKDVFLGREDHEMLTIQLTVEGEGWGQGFGGYALDEYDKKTKKRIGTAYGTQCILDLLDVFEVSDFYDLKGMYARVSYEAADKWGSKISKIGNITKNKWFSFRELAEKMTSKK